MSSPDGGEVAVVVGTRPELIKMAPLVTEMRGRGTAVRVIATGQHGDVLSPLFDHFGFQPDIQLKRSEQDRGSLNALLSGLLTDLGPAFGESTEAVVVQGDTTSALAGALAGFHRRIPVVHLEAGLRTYDLASPFPEEGNRRLIGQVADLHLAPTLRPREALLAEGVPPHKVVVTGNTVIDALLYTEGRLAPGQRIPRQGRTVLVTAHRRESWGAAFAEILTGVAACARRHPDTTFLWVAHPNPALRTQVDHALAGLTNATVSSALPYVDMVAALRSCSLVLTDSGGLQEEAPSFGKPVLVMRETTERPEAIEAGCAALVGTRASAIETAVSRLLDDPDHYRAMSSPANPYGDGCAAIRAADAIEGLRSAAISSSVQANSR